MTRADAVGRPAPGGSARVVLTTIPEATAEPLVRKLVEERLVACGNILPASVSVYRWRGEVERAAESLVVLKTTAAAVPRLIERVPELHPYEVPEVLVLPVTGGLDAYLDWIEESVGSESVGSENEE